MKRALRLAHGLDGELSTRPLPGEETPLLGSSSSSYTQNSYSNWNSATRAANRNSIITATTTTTHRNNSITAAADRNNSITTKAADRNNSITAPTTDRNNASTKVRNTYEDENEVRRAPKKSGRERGGFPASFSQLAHQPTHSLALLSRKDSTCTESMVRFSSQRFLPLEAFRSVVAMLDDCSERSLRMTAKTFAVLLGQKAKCLPYYRIDAAYLSSRVHQLAEKGRDPTSLGSSSSLSEDVEAGEAAEESSLLPIPHQGARSVEVMKVLMGLGVVALVLCVLIVIQLRS